MLGIFQVVVGALQVRGNVDDPNAIANLQLARRAALASSSCRFRFVAHLLLVLDIHVLSVNHAFVFLLTLSTWMSRTRSEEHTSELQSLAYLVCRLLLEKKKSLRSATSFALNAAGLVRPHQTA